MRHLWRVMEMMENKVGDLERTGATKEKENTGFGADSPHFQLC